MTPFVAPEQARLEVSVDRLVVTNLASNSGTIVEGDVLTGSRGLKARLTITIGSSTLEVTHQVAAPDRGRAPSASGSEGAEVRFNEFDQLLAAALRACANAVRPPTQTKWGGYSGAFADPDGYVWEIAFNPGWSLTADGSARLGSLPS